MGRAAGLGHPGGVGCGQGLRPLEERCGFGEGLAKETELGSYECGGGTGWRGRWLGGPCGARRVCVAEGECEEVYGVIEQGVEGRQGRYLDGVFGVDGVCLVWEGA